MVYEMFSLRKTEGRRPAVELEAVVETGQRVKNAHPLTSSASERRDIDHTVAYRGAKESRGHFAGIVDVVQHPAEVAIALLGRQA